MTATDTSIRVLDAAYKPFPTFAEWNSFTLVDSVRWDRYKGLYESRSDFSPAVLNRAREVAKRAAALDTGAIEGLYEVDRGFTYTVAFQAMTWEKEIAQRGEKIRPLFDAQLQAYDYVLSLATKAEPISEAAIRALHEQVCAAQNTYRVVTAVGFQEQQLPKGQYKSLPNHVRTRKGTDHSYAPVDVTPAETARLVAELRTQEFLAAHPVLQAAYVHYALVVIHPFADGNGRVARALASAFTYRAMSMPIVILSEHKDTYLDALEKADAGNYQSFVDFMLARSLDTIKLVDESIRSAVLPRPEESIAAISSLYLTKGGYTQDEVDQAGVKMMDLIQKELVAQSAVMRAPKITFNIQPYNHGGLHVQEAGYRFSIGGNALMLRVQVSSLPPAQAMVMREYQLLLPKNAAGDDDILVKCWGPIDTLVARMDEVTPMTSGVFQIRIRMFAERVLAEMLADLKRQAQSAMGVTP